MCSLRGSKITLIRDDGTHGLFFTPHHNKIQIGSNINCDVRINNEHVRKVHCIIFVDTTENVIKIKNLSKKNPTLLNGVRVKKYHEINNHDVIRIMQWNFLWTVSNKKPKRLSGGRTSDSIDDLEGDTLTEGDNSLPEKTLVKDNKRDKKINRRITCKINKIPIGNAGKRLKAQKRITIHDFRDDDKIDDWPVEHEEEVGGDVFENKIENTVTPVVTIVLNEDDEMSCVEKDVENKNTSLSRSTVKSNNVTPLKDITKLQEKNIMATPKGQHSMFPLESSTPFQMIENKNLSIAKLSKLEKSDSLVWSVSPATISHRGWSVAKSFANNSHNSTIMNELINVDTPENTVIKKTIASAVYLIDLTTPETSTLLTAQRTPNKSAAKTTTLLKSALKNSSAQSKSILHTTANTTIKKNDRSFGYSSVKKVLNMTTISNTTAVDKHKSLFLNKSITPFPTMLRQSPKTANLSLSTSNRRKSVNVPDKSNFLTVSGTPSTSFRKSTPYATPCAKTPVKGRVATPGRAQQNIKSFNEVYNTPNQFDRSNATADIGCDLTDKISMNDDSINVSALHDNIKTPDKYISINDLSDVADEKLLLSTPSANEMINKTPGKHIPINDLSDIAMINPAQDDLEDAGEITESMNKTEQHIVTNDITDAKELLNTSARDVRGVRELMKTPGKHIPINDLTDVMGVKELLNTPARDDLRDVRGVRELMKTPGKHIPTNDLTDVVGVRELLNTPARDDLRDVRGVKELMKTPGRHIPTNDLTDVIGVRELLNTPARDDLRDVRGVKELFKTPYEGHNPDFTIEFDTFTNMINSSCEIESDSRNVSMCTLPAIDIAPNNNEDGEEFEDAEEQDDDTEFNEDFVSKITSLDENKTMDETFDDLIGKKTISRTYSRKNTPEKRNNLTDQQTENIEKWVESVVNVGMDDVQPKPNNNQQILSNRYSNVTPQTSVVEPMVYNRDDINEVTDDEVDSDKPSSINSETEAMFKKTAVVDPVDLHVSFRCENFDLSFTSGSDMSDGSIQMSNIQNESALLNDESDDIIPSTQQQTPRRLTRSELKSNVSNRNNADNDSKETFVIEDDEVIPETQIEVFQGDIDDDVDDFGLEMSSQALETNISLVLNGEEEILTGLVDNDGDIRDSCIAETQIPLDEKSTIIGAKEIDSSILFIDDTIFMDKSKADSIESEDDPDDSSIILCADDSVNISSQNLHTTRSKSGTPSKITPKLSDTEPGKISKFQQEIEQCPTIIADTVEHLKIPRRKSKTVSPNKQLKSPVIKSNSIAVIDLSESFNESENEETADSDIEESDSKLQNEISGIEPLENPELSCELVYENSDDEIMDGVFDHLEQNVSTNSNELEKTNKTASQIMVEEYLEMDSEVFQNFDENEITRKARAASLTPHKVTESNKTSRKTIGALLEANVLMNTNKLDLENKSASQMMIEECLELESDVFQNFDENEIVRQARAASLCRENVVKSNRISRKTVGDDLDIKDRVVSKYESEIIDINLSVGDIDYVPKSRHRHGMSFEIKPNSPTSKEVQNKTISEINCEKIETINLSVAGTLESSDMPNETTPSEVDECKLPQSPKKMTTVDSSPNSSSIFLCDDAGFEGAQLRSNRSKSETPKKVDQKFSKTTRKTMGDALSEKTKRVSKFQEEVAQCSSNLDTIDDLTVPRTKSKSISPQKPSSKYSTITNKSVAVINLDDDDDISNNETAPYNLIYGDSDDDEMIDSVFDNLEKDRSVNEIGSEIEIQSVSYTTTIEECVELHSEVFENFNENDVVRQVRGASVTPAKEVKMSNSKASRKTMGDKLDLKDKVTSKFESEVNDINLSVGDIEQVPLTARRRAMSIGVKPNSSSEGIQNKTVSEINYFEPVIELSDTTPLETELIASEVVVEADCTVCEEVNLHDTLEHDESENLFNEEESDMFVPETQEIVGNDSANSASIVIIPETQADPAEVSGSCTEVVKSGIVDASILDIETEISQVEKSISSMHDTETSKLQKLDAARSEHNTEMLQLAKSFASTPDTRSSHAVMLNKSILDHDIEIAESEKLVTSTFDTEVSQSTKLDASVFDPDSGMSPSGKSIASIPDTVSSHAVMLNKSILHHDIETAQSEKLITSTIDTEVSQSNELNISVLDPDADLPKSEKSIISISDTETSQPERSIQNRRSQIHKLSLNSPLRTKSAKENRSQPTSTSELSKIIIDEVENIEPTSQSSELPQVVNEIVDETGQADIVGKLVQKTPASRKRRLYSKETYTPVLSPNESATDFQNNPTSTPFSKDENNLKVHNISEIVILSSVPSAKRGLHIEINNSVSDTLGVSKSKRRQKLQAPEKRGERQGKTIEDGIKETVDVIPTVETVEGIKEVKEVVEKRIGTRGKVIEKEKAEEIANLEPVQTIDDYKESNSVESEVATQIISKSQNDFIETLRETAADHKSVKRGKRGKMIENKEKTEHITNSKPAFDGNKAENDIEESEMIGQSATPSRETTVEHKSVQRRRRPDKLIGNDEIKSTDEIVVEPENEAVESKVIAQIASIRDNEISPVKKELETENTNVANLKVTRRVAFAEMPEEKFFEVLSEYDESLLKTSRGRRVLARNKIDTKKKINLDDNKDKEKIEAAPRNRSRSRQTRENSNTITAAPATKDDGTIEKRPARSTGKRAIPNKTKIETSESETMDEHGADEVIEKKTSGNSRRAQKKRLANASEAKTNDKEISTIVHSIDEEAGESAKISDSNLEATYEEIGQQKISNRIKVRRARGKNKLVEVVNETKIDNKNEIATDKKSTSDVEDVQSSELNVESFDLKIGDQKTSGRSKSRRLPSQKEIKVLLVDINAKAKSEIGTDVQEVSSEASIETKPTGRIRGRRAPMKKRDAVSSEVADEGTPIPVVELESQEAVAKKATGRARARRAASKSKPEAEDISKNDSESKNNITAESTTGQQIKHPAVKLDSPDKSDHGIGRLPAANRKNLESESESEVMVKLEKETGRGKGRRAPVNKKKNDEEELARETTILSNVKNRVVETEEFATPTKPAVRGRRLAIKQIIEVTDSESEQVSQSPTTGKRRRVVKKPSRYLDQAGSDADTSSNDHIDEDIKKPSTANKKNLESESENEVMVKHEKETGRSRGRRVAVNRKTKEDVLNIEEHTRETTIVNNRVATLESEEFATPTKPAVRGRRQAIKKTIELTDSESEPVFQSPTSDKRRRVVNKPTRYLEVVVNDADASSNEHIDEKIKKPKRGRRAVASPSQTETLENLNVSTPAKTSSTVASHQESPSESSSKDAKKTTTGARGRGRHAKLEEPDTLVETAKDETPVKTRGRRAASAAATEKLAVPMKRGRKLRSTEGSDVDLSTADLITNTTDSFKEPTPIGTKSTSRKNYKTTGSIDKATSSNRLKRKTEDESNTDESQVTDLKEDAETTKVSRTTRTTRARTKK